MINKIALIGRLGGDPDLRHLENGTAVCKFSLATSESYKDKNEEWQQKTEWHTVIVWRDLAERAAKNLKKGGLSYVEGKMTYRKYTDKDGIERYASEVVADNVRSLEAKEPATQEQPAQPAQPQRQPAATHVTPPTPAGDDLPF